MYKNIKINTLVNITMGLIITLVVVSVIAGYFQLSNIETSAERIISLRVPTAKASANMNTNINSSLAALRGWMLIKDEKFISERRLAWQLIRQQKHDMMKLSQSWTNPENINRLSMISVLLDKLENEQHIIEQIAHKPENVPSTEILFNNAGPLASKIIDNITTMINFAKTQPISEERMLLLAIMADLRGSFALSLAEIRAFLISGDLKFRTSFEEQWESNQTNYKQLNTMSGLLTLYEVGILLEINNLRGKFRILTKRMLASRTGEDWNKANYLLKTTAIITSQELIKLLVQMVANQSTLLEVDGQSLEERTVNLQIMMIVFLLTLLILSFYSIKMINIYFNLLKLDLDAKDSLIDQNVMMASLSTDGIILNISNSLCRHLKEFKKDLIGTQSNFFHSANDKTFDNEEIYKHLKTGISWKEEFLRTSNGEEEIWFSSHIIPVSKNGADIITYTIILEDISDRKRFEKVSVTDKLTSLYNRRKFDDVIEMEIKMAKRRKTYLSLAIIDIDFFKNYNDHYGHPAGDAALTQVASTLKSSFNRPDDYVFRLGGEEFGVLFNDLDKDQSVDLLERARQNIENLGIEHAESSVSKVITISTGVKVCSYDDMCLKDVFYSEADGALYNAKRTRNAVALADVIPRSILCDRL